MSHCELNCFSTNIFPLYSTNFGKNLITLDKVYLRFRVMGVSIHCIETVRRFFVPGHTANRDLRNCIRQHGMGYERERRLCKRTIQPPAEESSINGPPNARQAAGFVLKYKAGCFLFLRVSSTAAAGRPTCPFSKFGQGGCHNVVEKQW